MAASMTKETSGVRVVTHIIPLESKTESADVKMSSVEPEKSKMSLKSVFLKGKPLPLGLVQIFTGLVIMSLCTIALLVNMMKFEFIMCLGLPFVISGSVAVAAHRKSTPSLIRATLAMSVICALLAAAGTAYFSWELSDRPNGNLCGSYEDRNYSGNYWSCYSMFWRFNSLTDGVKGFLLVLCVLELCVSISLSIFSGRAIKQRDENDDDLYSSDVSLLKPDLDEP